MIQQRSISLLSSAERHLLRQQWRQNGQCLRCFHSSRAHMADEGKKEGNDKGTPYNTPKRGPNRQERAAKVSSEISALAADLPTENLRGRNADGEGAQPRNPDVSPQSLGQSIGGGRMGENNDPRQEGPFGQAVGRVSSEGDSDPTTSNQARGIRTPDSKLEDPSKGGASVMEPRGAVPEQPTTSDPNAGTDQVPAAAATTASASNAQPVAPAKQTSPSESALRSKFFSSGNNTHTLFNSEVPGMIQDRANLLSPRSTTSEPTKSEIERRLRTSGNKLTAFRTAAEKDAYMKPRIELEARLAKLHEDAKKEMEKGIKEADLPQELADNIAEVRAKLRNHPKFNPLPKTAQQDIMDRMVLGKYDEQGLLSGKQVHKQPNLNAAAKELLRNSTYLGKDSDQFLRKLRTLLPTAVAAPAAKKPQAKA